MRRFKWSSLFLCTLLVFSFSSVVQAETVEMNAEVSVTKCSLNNDDLVLCNDSILPFNSIEIPLTKKDVPEDASYELWEGHWEKSVTEEEISFTGAIHIQKYKYFAEDGTTSDWYHINGSIGRPYLSSRKAISTISVSVSSLSDLNSLALTGEPVLTSDYELTPNLYLGRSLKLIPVKPIKPIKPIEPSKSLK